jgi:hypothetical protein
MICLHVRDWAYLAFDMVAGIKSSLFGGNVMDWLIGLRQGTYTLRYWHMDAATPGLPTSEYETSGMGLCYVHEG